MLNFRCFVGLLCFVSLSATAQLRISEFMASNTHTLADENGSYEDWIEIENTSPVTVNLLDWSLTDSAGNLTKWTFPATNLPSGGFMVVFASGKDRHTAGAPLHTNFKLSADGEYLALVDPTGTNIVTEFAPAFPPQVPDVSFGFALTSSNITLIATNAAGRALVPSAGNGGNLLNYAWTGSAANEPFNVSGWLNGTMGAGFGVAGVGLNLQSAMLNSNASAFVRVPFVVNTPTNFSLLTLRLKYDDGFAAWLNGIPLAQANVPAEDLSWNSSATAVHGAGLFEEMVFGGATNYLRSGTNILAIQGLNSSAGDSSFLVLPELIGTTQAGESASGLYFTSPTPGSENLGGGTEPGPGIADATHTPNIPLDNDNLVVTARVFPTAHAVAGVVLHYRVMFNSEVTLNMLDDGAHGDGAAGDGIYGATIPTSASTSGQMVRYYITATDTSNTVSRLPVFSEPASTAQYYGTVVNPNYVTSSVPILHLFAPASVLQPGPTTSQTGADSETGGRVSAYFDGEFYDNIKMSLRGNTTASYSKKSHRLNFNKEHPFRYSDSAKRITKTSFVAEYPDPTYLRTGMSYWLDDLLGVPPPFYQPMRLQLNGVFYELANHSDVQETEMLERIGYNPTGAYYANVGTAQPGGYSTGNFEKKTRLTEDNTDYNTLINAVAPALSVGQKWTNLLDRLDLPEVISYVVAARFTHQNDDVWAGMALYHDNDGDDLWRIMPYDQNLSWGAAFMDADAYSGIQVTNDNYKSFPMYGSSQAIPANGGGWNGMYDLIFQVPQTREMFLRSTRTMLDTYVKPPGTPAGTSPIEQRIVQWRDLIAADAAVDRAWWGWPVKGGQCNFDPGINLTNGVNSLLNDFFVNRRNHFYGKHSITNTALPIGISKSSNAGIPLAQPTNAIVSIIGWDYNPVSGNQDEEYVLLTNANNFAVDISGWKLDGGIEFKFKPGTVIPTGGTLYVSPNTRAFRNRATSPHGGQARFVVGPYSGHLNAWGESLTLTNSAGVCVSSNSFAGTPSAVQRYLRVTEIMYNPSPAPAITNDAQQFEYVELKNISTNVTLNLNGVRFTNGIYFNFTGSAVTSLAPGQTVLVVRNQSCFTARYGGGFNIAGQFTGALDNGGEELRLEDAVGEKILEFDYDDDWYPITDGLGFSLVIVDENAPWNTWDKKSSWRASGTVNGSPGSTDPTPPVIGMVVVNEALTHTDLPELDSVELYNPTASPINIGGWFLTDDFFTPKKYRIPNGTTIPAQSYLVITEAQFNTGANAFRFSELGESVYLFSADSATTNLTGYYHGYDFPAAPNGVSFGNYTNSQGDVQFVLQSAITLGAVNAYPRVGPIVVSEIMYHPPDTNGVDDDLDEFIELQNITTTNVPLYFVSAPTNTWHLRNAVDFDFPTNQSLAAGARLLVVGFDPTNAAQLAAFRASYNVSNTVPVFGPWSGKLDNSGETIELKQPGAPDDTLLAPYYMVDKIAYRDAAPWPAGADGIGNSLQRVNLSGFGNDPTNWFAAGVTAGRANLFNHAPVVSITSPTNGATVESSSNIIVSVLASDPDGGGCLVRLLANGSQLAQWTALATNYTWANPAAGTYTLQAMVTDNLGAVGASETVTLKVTAPLPTVTITFPTNQAVLVSGSSVQLAANAYSGGGSAAGVNYYVDGGFIGSAGAPFTLSWTPNSQGSHTISAVPVDGEGQAGNPAVVGVYVQGVTNNPPVIDVGATWRYLDDGSDQGTAWIQPAFNDQSWSNGPAELGFGDGGEATVIRHYGTNGNASITYYFRKQFVVPAQNGVSNLLLNIKRDDGAIVYLNGVEVFRSNMPTGPVTYQTCAPVAIAGSDENLFVSTNVNPGLLTAGTNTLAVEIHQTSTTSSDVSFDAQLILQGSWLAPAILSQPADTNVYAGAQAAFAVTTTGTAPLAYRWFGNDTLLSSVTNSLMLTNVQPVDAGDYFVVVSNWIGSVTSSVATLTFISDDQDNDGLPDWWEQNYFGGLGHDGSGDSDGDGFNDLQEYLAGTVPTNSVSALKFDSATFSGGHLILQFFAASNHAYTVQSSPMTNAGVWQKWLDVPANPANRTVFLTNSISDPKQFYRLVTPPLP